MLQNLHIKLKYQLRFTCHDKERLQENIYVKGSKSMFVKIYKTLNYFIKDMIIKAIILLLKNENQNQ